MDSNPIRILIVEDEKLMRIKLKRTLESELGAEVLMTENGLQALTLFKEDPTLNFIISDWIMPKMDGPELCRNIRRAKNRGYTYFILATARSENDDVLAGMASGADDYITKPIDPQELSARIRAGLRMLDLERSLADRNRELEEALYSASRMQQVALPTTEQLNKVRFGMGLNIAYYYQSCESVGGDILGLMCPNDEEIVITLGDVSGHGIQASLASVGLYTHIVTNLRNSSDPIKLISDANKYCGESFPDGIYSTLAYLRIRPKQMQMDLLMSGHPSIFRIAKNAEIQEFESRYAPLGLWDDSPQESDIHHIEANKGDRLILYTDGIIEATNPEGKMYGAHGLLSAIDSAKSTPLNELLQVVIKDMNKFRHTNDKPLDDISLMALEF